MKASLMLKHWKLLGKQGLGFIDSRVVVKKEVYPGIPHGFTLFPTLPASDLALKRAAHAIKWLLSE